MLPTPVPGVVLLNTRVHHDSFADMTPDLLGELGPMIARMERAVEWIGDVGRVHLNRWGDGGGHFHLWFIPRGQPSTGCLLLFPATRNSNCQPVDLGEVGGAETPTESRRGAVCYSQQGVSRRKAGVSPG